MIPAIQYKSDHGGGCGSGGSCGCSSASESNGLVTLNLGKLKAERSCPDPGSLTFAGTPAYPQGLLIGLDVGSTTVKYVVVNPPTGEILAKDYQRHDTKQPEKCLEMLQTIESRFPEVPSNAFRIFMTGSGGSAVGRHIGAKFVQEVNAVTRRRARWSSSAARTPRSSSSSRTRRPARRRRSPR